MNRHVLISLLLSCTCVATAQVPSPGTATNLSVKPQVSEILISPDAVSEIHLRPNIATSILMPEPVADVVLGAPELFNAEHSEHAPQLVVVKPITKEAATSNLLISTKSGQHVSLRLISDGDVSTDQPVDYVLVYRIRHDFLIPSDDPADAVASGSQIQSPPPSVLESAFEAQQRLASPVWKPDADAKHPSKIAASIGSVNADGNSLVVAFSVLNQSSQWVEILPPQVELNNPAAQAGKKPKKKHSNILADQIPITDYRYTQRKLAPGQRVDGVVRFERPDFKQAQEHLQLELATADAVNEPVLLNLIFTAPANTHSTQEDTDARP